MVVAAAKLYLKGLDFLHNAHDHFNDVLTLINFFGTKLSDWLSSPKVFTNAFDCASRSQKESKVDQATFSMCDHDIVLIKLFQVWEDLLEYDLCYSVKQCWHSKAEEIIRLRFDKVQLCMIELFAYDYCSHCIQ